MKKRITAIILILALSISLINISAFAEAAESIIIMNYTFNDLITGSTPEELIMNGFAASVVEDGNRNKALFAPDNGSHYDIRYNAGAFGENYVLSISLKSGEIPVKAKLGISADASGTPSMIPIYIDNNIIKTHDNKEVGSINNRKYTDIAIVVKNSKYFDLYIDGRCKLNAWNMPSQARNGYAVFIKEVAGESSESGLYIDNFRMYKASRIYKCIPDSAYNNTPMKQLNIDTDVGDYEYFDSNEPYLSPNQYARVGIYPKTNTITCGRFDHTNPNRNNEIYMKKTTSDDCFFDITMIKHGYLRSKKRFNYFLMEGDYMVEDLNANIMMCMIRDYDSSSARQDAMLAYLTPGGNLRLTNKQITLPIANKKWFNLKVAFNLLTHKYDVYFDNECVASDVSFNSNLNILSLLRFGFDINEDSGVLRAKDVRLTGLEKAYVNGVETKTSIFQDDKVVEDFLEGKTAFHSYGKLIYANGEKTPMDSLRDGDECYVDAAALNTAFGFGLSGDKEMLSGDNIEINASGKVRYQGKTVDLSQKPKVENNKIYVPITAFSKEVLKKYVFYFETGMYIVSDTEFALDTEGWEEFCKREFQVITDTNSVDELNSFLSFERPSVDKIAADFNEATQEGSAHPRILVKQDAFDRIKNNYKNDKTLNDIVTKVLEEADKYAAKEPLEYGFQDTFRQNFRSGEFSARMLYIGFAWKITGDRKYFEAGWKNLEKVCSYPDYNTCHILDTGEWNTGLAVGYDWFYDGFSEEQRVYVRDAILNKSLKELADGYYGRISSESPGSQRWTSFKWMSNYNAVMNSGTITAALAVAEDAPDYCFDVVKNGLRSIEYTLFALSPDGGWAESPSYWGMTMEYYLFAVSSLINATGNDYGLTKYKGVDNTLSYIISLNGPCGVNNFHDAAETSGYTTNALYMPLSQLFDDMKGYTVRKAHVESGETRPEIFDALFYDVNNHDKADIDKLIITEGVESFAFNADSDWKSGGLFLSGHFGLTSCYHSQNDTGTFVLDMLGERWAMDLGPEDYNLNNVGGVPLWATYRRRAEGHNIMVINPGEQYNQTEGLFIPITKSAYNEYGGYVITDMEGVYADTTAMKTGYYVGNNYRTVTIRNEMDLKKQSDLYWFMHTRANVVVEGNTAYLTQHGKSVKVTVGTNADEVELSVMNARPMSTSPDPAGQNQNEGIRKLAIKMKGKGHVDLTVQIAPMGESAANAPLMDKPIDEWELPQAVAEEKSATNLDFKLYSDGTEVNSALPHYENSELPDFEVKVADPDNTIVEVQKAQTSDEISVVKVYDKERKYCNVGSVIYTEVSGKSMNAYNQIPIENVIVSQTPEAENNKDNMLDGIFTTRWTSMGKGEYAIFDLGSVQDVDGVGMAFWKGNVRTYTFKIQVSEDGKTYKDVYEGESNGESELYEVFDFDRVKARYVKFVGYGNSEKNATGVNNNILEFRALQSKY